MHSAKYFLLAALALGIVGVGAFQAAPEKEEKKDEKPKFTIKEVMKKAHAEDGDELRDKFLAGKANDAEKKLLGELYMALALNKPPKGDAASWKAKTEAINKAFKAGDKDALKQATKCAVCHDAHKGD
jgi:hypothetical protein